MFIKKQDNIPGFKLCLQTKQDLNNIIDRFLERIVHNERLLQEVWFYGFRAKLFRFLLQYKYHTRAIITRCLYIYYPIIFKVHFFVSKKYFLWKYVFMYCLYSRALCNQKRAMLVLVRYSIYLITLCQPIVCSGFIQKYPAIYHQMKQVQTDFDWNDFKWEIHLVYFAGSHYCLPIWVVTISDQPHLVPKKIQREKNYYSEQIKSKIFLGFTKINFLNFPACF